jgi:hypothetical protein
VKLRDFLSGDCTVHGWQKVQTWVDDDCVVIKEGYDLYNMDKYLDADVLYVFPFMRTNTEAAICIEVEHIA